MVRDAPGVACPIDGRPEISSGPIARRAPNPRKGSTAQERRVFNLGRTNTCDAGPPLLRLTAEHGEEHP